MKHVFFAAAFLASACAFAQKSSTSNYQRLWEHIERQEFKQAEDLLAGKRIEPDKAGDAYITGLYLKTYRQSIDESTDFIPAFYKQSANPDPYIYSLWFSSAVVGQYGKKKPHQISLIQTLQRNPKTFGTLRAAAYYQYGMHYLFQNQFDSAHLQYQHVGGLQHWQYVGPFENLSQSGIYKSYGPLEKADGKSEFTSITNAKVKWFTPSAENPDGWIPMSNQFTPNTAVTYAQTFVNSPTDQDVLINVGCTGSIRVWVNDAMVLSETMERVTELDAYTAKCKLQKGNNRILVQLSFTQRGYANFGMRLTDTNFEPLPLTGSSVFKPYTKATQSPVVIPHFAETFFLKKIQDEPKNPVNYLLLADVYLRNLKTLEARNILETALAFSDNNLLRSKLIEVLLKEDNETGMLEEIDKIRRSDPTCALILEIDIRNNTNTQRYGEATELLTKYEGIYGEDLKTLLLRIGILAKESKFNDMVALTESTFKKYPDEPKLIQTMFIIEKEVHRNKEAGMKIYDDYLKQNYNYNVFSQYVNLLHQEGKASVVAEKRKWFAGNFPHETFITIDNANYHITAKEYTEAERYLKQALDLSPYNKKAWSLLGDVKREQDKKAEAIEAYQRSLQYDPNQYEVIGKLRTLAGKPETYKIVPQVNIDDVLAKDVPPDANLTSEAGYYIILDDKSIVMHAGGATEEFNSFVVRITNEKGIEDFKQSTVPYESNQTLFMDKFEVIKRTGARIRGDRNDNEVVFTNLEVGDVIVFQYRYQNYFSGRFARELWSQKFFQDNSYSANIRYSILLPATRKLNYVMLNSTLKPTTRDVEDFKQYTWELTRQHAYNSEPYMPAVADVLPILHTSTLNSWNEIATWYADMINKSSEETFELTKAFQTIFAGADTKGLSEFETARRIYAYIEDNIRYSSVSFRQGAYRPQSASQTLITRLGDCKDLSNLFMKLCEMAGIKVRMVLIDTRDNGEKDMVLPSLEFNHCIAKATLDGKEYYIELTDSKLPFTSLPNNIPGAQILEIPLKGEVAPVDIKNLVTTTKPSDIAKADLVIKPSGNDLNVYAKRTKYGNPTSFIREDFSELSYDKQLIKLQEYVTSQSKNVVIDTVFFTDLESLHDSVSFSYRYTMKDEVSEIANLKTFKLIFPDVVATSNHFVSATREYPVNFQAYEDMDYYETTIRVELEQGKKLLELPSNVSLSFGGMTYELKYILVSPQVLVVSRKYSTNRKRIDAKEYTNVKTFLDNIVKAEKRMIAFQ